MKFHEGAWLWAKGVKPHLAQRVHDYRIDGDELWISACDRQGAGGIDRVEGSVLQAYISSPMPGVIRVCANRHDVSDPGRNNFELDYSLRASGVTIDESPDVLTFTSGRLSLRISTQRWAMDFIDTETGESITGGGSGSLGLHDVPGDRVFITQRLSLGPNERIYGLGERFGPLAKNGQTVVIRNEDGGTVSDQAYKNIPFYLSSRGYGLLVNSPSAVEFEVATERVSQVQFSVPGEVLDYYIFFGPDPKTVLDKYTALAGRPAVPPAWSFGLWLSTSFTTQYNESTVTEFVDGMAKCEIPLSVFHFDCFWMKERQWCDFEWDRKAFTDPEGMIRRLKAKGLKVCLWINPYISQLSPLFKEGRDNGYFLKTADGKVYQRTQWQPGMAFVDFTNPAAVTWYTGKLRKLLEMGVDCFKTDFGERIPDDAMYHDGSQPELMHNLYAYLYNQAVFQLLEEFHGAGNAMVFARSASGGSQKFPVHWGGDCEATFESMAEDLRGGLSFCLSGPAFWSHDIGGFGGKANPSLYKRWVAFGLLSTHSRLHGNESYRVPWIFDEESVDVMRQFAQLKNKLFPYLFAAAHDAQDHGWPVMRAMMLEFPADPTCLHLEHQYMLGSSLLVAPVLRQDDIAEYYLPAGKWTNVLDGSTVVGGRWFREKIGYKQIPLFARPGSIVAMSNRSEAPAWTINDQLTLHLYQLTDGADVSLRIVPSSGSAAATFRCTMQNAQIRLESDGRVADVRVVIHGGGAPTRLVNGKLLREGQLGSEIAWTDSGKPLSVVLAS